MSDEVDLSNGLGIIEAIKGAKSLIPILLFSYKNIGTKGQELKKSIKFYSKMLNRPTDDIAYLNYIISHVPENLQKNDIKS